MYRLLYIFVILTAITACTSSAVKHKLSTAEEMMTERPDSALELIQAIDTSDLRTKSEKALYALLLSQALDKNYIDLTSDSIIAGAVDYYSHSDDRYHDMLSQYYFGRIKYNAGDFPRSLVAMFKAHDIAKELNLNFWIAMTARGIADVYNETYNGADELEYTKIEAQYFHRNEVQPYINHSLLDVSCALCANSKYSDAIDLSYQLIDSAKKYSDITTQYESHRLIGIAQVGLKNYPEAIKHFEYLCSNGFAELNDSLLLGISYANTSNIAKAKEIYNSVGENSNLKYYWLGYEISIRSGMHDTSLGCLRNLDSTLNTQFSSRIRQELASSVVNYYDTSKKLTEANLRATHIRIWLIIICFVVIVLMLSIILFFYSRRIRNIRERNIIIANELQEMFSLMADERKKMNTKLGIAQESIRNVISSKFDIFDKLCQPIFENNNSSLSKKRIADMVNNLISDFTSNPKKISELEEFVNLHSDNLISNFKLDFPTLKEVDYRLFLFNILGFSVNSISLFLGESKITSIYDRKRRIKDKIKKFNGTNREKYLKAIS